jgi:hypothetical protein
MQAQWSGTVSTGVPSMMPARVVAVTAGPLLAVVVPAAIPVSTGVAATIVAVARAVVPAVLATDAAVVVE